jgi:superfamily II DNA or RNA helicase
MSSKASTAADPTAQIPWLGRAPRVDDRVWIAMDAPALAHDVIALDGALLALVEQLGSPGTLRFLLPGEDGGVELEVDAEGRLAAGARLDRLAAHMVSGRLCCRVVETGAPVSAVAVEPVPWRVAPRPGLDPGLAALLAAGRPAPAAELRLHDDARRLGRSTRVDTLVCESLLRGFTPFEYQRAVVRAVLGRFRGRAILADEVGLGKTVEACMALTEYLARRLVRRCLVLVPPSLVEQWRGELAGRFGLAPTAPDDPAFVRAGDRAWDTFPLLLSSLALAKREPHRSRILASRFDMVIVDEAHHLRNDRTLAHQLVSAIPRRFTLLLTATPVQNDLLELFHLVTLLKPGQLDTRTRFKRRHVGREGPRDVDSLRASLAQVMVRNRRSQCGLELPPRHATTRVVHPSPAERSLYDRLTGIVREHHRRRRAAGEGRRQGSALAPLLLRTLQQQVGSSARAVAGTLAGRREHAELAPLATLASGIAHGAKVAALVEIVTEMAEPCLVFTQYRATQAEVVEGLAAAALRPIIYHGALGRREKDRAVDTFRSSGGVLVATESGGEGRNLQFCRNLVNYDLPWNPMRIEQRVGRLHRIGQTRPVRVVNLLLQGTLEDHLFRVLETKIGLFELVVGELDMILGELEDEGTFEERVFDSWAGATHDDAGREALAEIAEILRQNKDLYARQLELSDRVLGDALSVVPPRGTGPHGDGGDGA